MPETKSTRAERQRAEHEADLAWAIRGVLAQSAGYNHFLDGLAAERERRLALPQFAVKLHLPTMPERKPAGREENESEVAA